jgi:uncharacterized membrane protein (UPF0182 family)
MPRSRKLLCVFYGLVAVVALFATWSQNLTYSGNAAEIFGAFWTDTKVNAASRSITVDIGLFLLAATGFMVTEARRIRIRFVWAYVVLGVLIAISVTFPLFMIARELRLTKKGASEAALQLTATDLIGLAVTTAFILGMVWFTLN